MNVEQFVFESFVGQQSYNKNLLIHELKNPAQKWVGKVSKPLAPWANFRDLDDRAILASRLAKLVKIDMPEMKVVKGEQILGFDSFESLEKINDNIFLTKYWGINLLEFLKTNKAKDILNFEKLYDFLVFNLWVGNYDKKTEDYLIDKNGNLATIDFQLSGPGFTDDPDAAIGGWLTKYYLTNPSHTGWCLEGATKNQRTPIIRHVRKIKPNIGAFKKQIEIIKGITKGEIVKAVHGLDFRGLFEDKINNDYVNFLLNRSNKLEATLKDWIKAGYPNEIDQQQLHQKRKADYFKQNLV